MPLPQREDYTIEDIYALPEGTRAELIDGQIYYMAPENTRISLAHCTGRLQTTLTVKVVPAKPMSLHLPYS